MKFLTWIALRHLWSKHSFGFISFSTSLSIIGLMLGISSLIIISCVSDGFSEIINKKLSDIDGHIRISSYIDGELNENNIHEIDSLIYNATNKIDYTSPYIEKHAIIRKGSLSEGVIIYGVPDEALNQIFHLNQFTKNTSKFINENSIIIGRKLAELLDLKINDNVILIDPEIMATEQLFKVKAFTLINTFQTNFPEYDRLLAFIPLETAKKYFSFGNNVSGLIINVDTQGDIDKIDKILYKTFKNHPYVITTWKERHASLLDWLNIYDIPIKMIMFFITIVGVLNIGASLWMIIIEKTKDFGVLQSLGLDKSSISHIILIEGIVIGMLGSILGIISSFVLLFLENNFHFIKLPNDIYFMDHLPVKIFPIYFIIYPCITFVITILFSYLPAFRASSISPSEALRYE